MHSVPPTISPRTEKQGVDALSRECTMGLRLGEGSLGLLASFILSSVLILQSLLSQGTAAKPALGLGSFHF